MKKIKTIFERNWEGDGKIRNEESVKDLLAVLENDHTIVATEKLDGMNVRVTVRNHVAVRLEKRRNPSKLEKAKGIIEPWYTDASMSSEDKYLQESLKNTDLSIIPDGEWSGEALGPNIQANTLNLEKNIICFFSLDQAPVFIGVPTSYEELKEWLPKQKSKYGKDCGIEGIVWHTQNGEMFKIKTKDFL